MFDNNLVSRFLLLSLLALPACVIFGGSPGESRRQAETALARGDTSRAIRLYSGMIRSSTVDAESIIRLGQLYRSTGTISGRLHSQNVLEAGTHKFPDHPVMWFELGRTYYAQTFYPDAERCFNHVLELDRDHCDAHYYIALNFFRKWNHVQLYTGNLEKAIPHFARVRECDPQNIDSFFKLAFSKLSLGDTLRAIQTCQDLLSVHPRTINAEFLLGAIAMERDDHLAARQQLGTALALLDDDDREHMLSISLLLPDEDAEDYDNAASNKKQELRRIYWAEHDPDPTTEMNERYMEHVYRMFLADLYYHHARLGLRGWETERGRALVKFGWPRSIRTTLEGVSFQGRTEIWTYGSADFGFRFFFSDEFLNGNYIIPMTGYATSAQVLFMDPPRTSLPAYAVMLPGVADVVSFRLDEISCETFIAAMVDIDSIASYVDLGNTHSFITRSAFFDDEWQPYLYHADTLDAAALIAHRRTGARYFSVVARFELPFNRHKVAFAFQDDASMMQTLIKTTTNTLKYLTDSLAVSDVLLYKPTPPTPNPSLITRRGRTFFPNPSGQYDTDEKLRLYLEVYNLGVSQTASHYDVTYSIYEAPRTSRGVLATVGWGLRRMMGFVRKPVPVISQTLERSTRRHEAEEDLAIDIDTLEPGSYVLSVKVSDRISGATAQRTKLFIKGTPAVE